MTEEIWEHCAQIKTQGSLKNEGVVAIAQSHSFHPSPPAALTCESFSCNISTQVI